MSTTINPDGRRWFGRVATIADNNDRVIATAAHDVDATERRIVRRLLVGAIYDGTAYMRLPDDATDDDRREAAAMLARLGGRDA